jgi:nucleoside-diphosphate-sugar epimerase
MRVLVTGSAGHLGEALVRTLKHSKHEVVGLDLLHSPCTTDVGSIVDRDCLRRCMDGLQAVFHAATLHKPHIATHSRQDFVDTNITGTLNLLEEAVNYQAEYERQGWKIFPSIEQVYVNLARNDLGWRPRYDFACIISRLAAGDAPRSPLARLIGAKGITASGSSQDLIP